MRTPHGRSRARFLVTTIALALSGVANAQKKDEITFNLVPNPDTIGCLRANNTEEPRARATVIRGKVNDTLILDLDGIRPGLAFDLFTVQRSPLLADGSKDPAFTNVFNGSFGLAWYQSDIQIQHSDNGHVRIQTILLDDIFGFDPDVRLAPTNTFHVGFWFDDPNAAKDCGFDPTKPKPFNGEHKSGPRGNDQLARRQNRSGTSEHHTAITQVSERAQDEGPGLFCA